MTPFDWVLVVILAGFVWGGFWTGLIQSIGGVIGLFVGVILAARFAAPFGEFLTPVFGGQAIFSEIAAFGILFLLAGRLIGLAFVLVNRVFNLFAVLPGMKLLNRLAGGLFGLLEGALYLGIILQYTTRLPLGPGLTASIQDSVIAQTLMMIAAWLVALFPKALRETEKVIDRTIPVQ